MLKKSIQYTSFYINISLNWMQRNFLICESAYVLFYFREKKNNKFVHILRIFWR